MILSQADPEQRLLMNRNTTIFQKNIEDILFLVSQCNEDNVIARHEFDLLSFLIDSSQSVGDVWVDLSDQIPFWKSVKKRNTRIDIVELKVCEQNKLFGESDAYPILSLYQA